MSTCIPVKLAGVVTLEMVISIYDNYDNFSKKNNFLWSIDGYVLNNIFPSNILVCFCLEDFIKIVRLFLAVVSIEGLTL